MQRSVVGGVSQTAAPCDAVSGKHRLARRSRSARRFIQVCARKTSSSERRPDSLQLIRQWTILRLLSDSPRSWAIKELADQLQVSKATIERDIATLERDFAVVEESVGKQKKT